MGNQLLKKYEAEASQEAEGGPHLKWRCIPGRHRERPQESVTLFVFEKSSLDTLHSSTAKDRILETLRKDSAYLQKLRHPCILPLMEPLVEDKVSLAFATKPVMQTLAGYLTNMSLPSKAEAFTRQVVPLEARLGFLDICEALLFLHQDVKLAHLNLSPTSIFIAPQGRWYLGSLGFAQPILDGTNSDAARPPFLGSREDNESSKYGTKYGSYCPPSPTRYLYPDPPLAYCAPECTQTYPNRPTYSEASDIFSFGLLLAQFAVPGHQALLKICQEADTLSHQQQGLTLSKLLLFIVSLVYPMSMKVYLLAHMAAKLVSRLEHFDFPTDLKALLSRMLSLTPETRPSISEVHEFFLRDIDVRALRFLESLHEKNVPQQIQFLIGFNQLLQAAPQKLTGDLPFLRTRVLPTLLNLLNFANLLPYVLPCLFSVLRMASYPEHFKNDIWPRVRPLLSAREIQINAVIEIINHLDFLMSIATIGCIIEEDILPFVIKCLAIPEISIQHKLLDVLTDTAQRLPYIALRTSVLPCALNLLVNPHGSSPVRVKTLRLISQIAKSFDRATITERIVTALEKTTQLDRNATVIVACAQTLAALADIIGPQLTCVKLLPVLVRLPGDENLHETDFEHVLSITLQQLQKVAETRRKYFKDLQLLSHQNFTVTKAGMKQWRKGDAADVTKTLNAETGNNIFATTHLTTSGPTTPHALLEDLFSGANNYESTPKMLFSFTAPQSDCPKPNGTQPIASYTAYSPNTTPSNIGKILDPIFCAPQISPPNASSPLSTPSADSSREKTAKNMPPLLIPEPFKCSTLGQPPPFHTPLPMTSSQPLSCSLASPQVSNYAAFDKLVSSTSAALNLINSSQTPSGLSSLPVHTPSVYTPNNPKQPASPSNDDPFKNLGDIFSMKGPS